MSFKEPKDELVSIRAKIKKENYIELERYCKNSNITLSSYIRALIEKERPIEASIKKAGVNFFRFNPLEDKFSWEIKFDDGTKKEIAVDLSNIFLENLKIAIDKALVNRKEHIKQKIEGSILIPSKINKLMGSGENVKG